MSTALSHGRGWLEAPAAASIVRVDREIGHPLQITEAGRTWEQQNAHWLNYQRNGYPIALHPDTPSVHQKGYAIDTDEGQRILDVMTRHGWRRTVYRNGVLVEPWHFEYQEQFDTRRNDKTTNATEDDMAYPIRVNKTHLFLVAPGHVKHFESAEAADLAMKVTTQNDEWIDLSSSQFALLLDGFGIPRDHVDARDGLVRDPSTGKMRKGGLWRWDRTTAVQTSTVSALTAAVEAVAAAKGLDPAPIIAAAQAGAEKGARAALENLVLRAS